MDLPRLIVVSAEQPEDPTLVIVSPQLLLTPRC